MRFQRWSRRELLQVSAASAAGMLFVEPLRAAAPPATAVTPALIEAARKEGKLSFYSALELNVAERVARTFEAKYPGIAVRVERSGAEGYFSASRRSWAAVSRQSTSPIPPIPRITSTGRRTTGSSHICRKRRQGIFRQTRSTPMAPTQRCVPGSKRSATTPTWSSARTRQRAMRTCSTRNGAARS